MEGYIRNSSDFIEIINQILKKNPELKKRPKGIFSITDKGEMGKYINLLEKSIDSIQGKEAEEAEQTIFDFGGYQNLFEKETVDNFELVSFLIID